jgi:hypothetical protein
MRQQRGAFTSESRLQGHGLCRAARALLDLSVARFGFVLVVGVVPVTSLAESIQMLVCTPVSVIHPAD